MVNVCFALYSLHISALCKGVHKERAQATWVPVQGDVEEMDVEQTAPSAEDKGKGKATAPSNGKRFEIKKWNAVAMWSWAICTDTCAICRNNLYEPSIEYQVTSQA